MSEMERAIVNILEDKAAELKQRAGELLERIRAQ